MLVKPRNCTVCAHSIVRIQYVYPQHSVVLFARILFVGTSCQFFTQETHIFSSGHPTMLEQHVFSPLRNVNLPTC